MNGGSTSNNNVICVTGASGFIGSHFLPALLQSDVAVRALSRRPQTLPPSVSGYLGDLADRSSLDSFLRGADILINLAQPGDGVDRREFEICVDNLGQAASRAGVQRVLHVSTATVVGRTGRHQVDDSSRCRPATEYERRKYAAEKIFLARSDEFDLGILRPTAVFGFGGRNLLKLFDTIVAAPSWRRYWLRFLHGQRRMHLVPVDDVVSALFFLLRQEGKLAGQVFLVSADDEPNNNYQAVDACLGLALDRPPRFPAWSLPWPLLKGLLWLARRSQFDPRLRYNASRLAALGFERDTDFDAALRRFADDCLARRPSS